MLAQSYPPEEVTAPPPFPLLDGYADLKWAQELEEERRTREKKLMMTMDEDERERHVTGYVERIIGHSRFRNYPREEAEQYLATAPLGEVLFRPSGRGPDHLTASWKVADGVISHVGIDEDPSGKTNRLELSSRLRIGKEEYDDLDEVLARHMEPMVNMAAAVRTHGKFVDGPWEQVKDVLRASRRAAPKRVAYALSFVPHRPGNLYLTWADESWHRENVLITPEGLRWRQFTAASPDHLISLFKRHGKEPPPPLGGSRGLAPGGQVQHPAPPGRGGSRFDYGGSGGGGRGPMQHQQGMHPGHAMMHPYMQAQQHHMRQPQQQLPHPRGSPGASATMAAFLQSQGSSSGLPSPFSSPESSPSTGMGMAGAYGAPHGTGAPRTDYRSGGGSRWGPQ